MTDQNQLLREALQDIEQAHDLSLDLEHYASRQVLVSLADKIKVALAQPAESGEACRAAWVKKAIDLATDFGVTSLRVGSYERLDGIQSPGMASFKTVELRKAREAARERLVQHLHTTPPASQDQAQQPSPQAWANETGLRQIECPSCGDLAVAYDPQQPSEELGNATYDALTHGTGVLKDSGHIPLNQVIQK